ncbi:MAG: 4'-phosphopantetheinyl transferase superfamily protein [Acidobacteria bacterium]|nr:4'-phosphopantetheinyl transferase superfamily protein [Acidobacteriota bacterium]
MIVGLGIDVVEISRIREVWQRHGNRFLQRVFTAGETVYCILES